MGTYNPPQDPRKPFVSFPSYVQVRSWYDALINSHLQRNGTISPNDLDMLIMAYFAKMKHTINTEFNKRRQR